MSSCATGTAGHCAPTSRGADWTSTIRRSGCCKPSITSRSGTTPAWLKISRSGDTFTAYTSADGVTWTLIPGSTVTVSLGSALLAGLAVTSHHSGALCTVTMDGVSVG